MSDRSQTFTVDATKETTAPAIKLMTEEMMKRVARLKPDQVKNAVGKACVTLTQRHLRALPPNKMGWPSQGFYAGAAQGTDFSRTSDGVKINIENPAHPGAMRQRYHGGTITAKDKLLTIPARPEFYGQRATSFTNLQFDYGLFRATGIKALIIGTGGTDQTNFATGREHRVKGAGVRNEGLVAFWLVGSVTQKADHTVVPKPEEYLEASKASVWNLFYGGKG